MKEKIDTSQWFFISGTSNHDFDEMVRKKINRLLIGKKIGKSPTQIVDERFPETIKTRSSENLSEATIEKIKDALMEQLIEEEHENDIIKWKHLDMRRFPDKEPDFRIEDYKNIKGKNVVIFQSIYDLPYENQTIDLIWAWKNQYGAKRVILIAPFFRYRRQDHPEIEHEINRNLRFCQSLKKSGLDEIVICEIHSQQTIDNLENVGILVHHITPHALYAQKLIPIIKAAEREGKEIYLYSPDKGSVPRAASVAEEIKKMGYEISISVTFKNRINGSQTELMENQKELEKIRQRYPDLEIFATDQRIQGAIIIMLEDELSTGGTAKSNGVMLKNKFEVYGLVFIAAHPVCTWGWKSKFIENTPFTPIILGDETFIGIMFGNTIFRHYEKKTGKVKIINFDALFAEKVVRIMMK
jgi:phosphoribosylpyrophosphate synthetase